jgi:CheY-like chemotaxis protein
MKTIQQCLIIDDDEDDQEIFVMCVNKISDHIRCTTMNNGVEAIALLQADESYSPEYIFIDMNMPKMNGIECLKHIRAIERLRNSSIFMYSTTSETSVVSQSKALGATDFIIKPAKTAELKEKLSAIFSIASVIDPKP